MSWFAVEEHEKVEQSFRAMSPTNGSAPSRAFFRVERTQGQAVVRALEGHHARRGQRAQRLIQVPNLVREQVVREKFGYCELSSCLALLKANTRRPRGERL